MKNNVDKQYLEFLQYILENGEVKEDRTGTGTISIFDYSMKFDMMDGFPLLTSKKVFTKAVIHELIWFLNGETNIKYLVDNGVNIWNGDTYKNYLKKWKPSKVEDDTDTMNLELVNERPLSKDMFIECIKIDDEFAKKWGELGPIYGKQWRKWNGETNDVDQILNLINTLKLDPDSRRMMVSAWNVGELNEMVLPPCHYGFQCYTNKMTLDERKRHWLKFDKPDDYSEDATHEFLDGKGVPERKLSLKWHQRSCDVPLGIPFNIASYGILLHLIAREVNMSVGNLSFTGGDCHIYKNQIEKVREQLESETYDLPELELTNDSLYNIKYEDIKITGYSDKIENIKFPLSN